MCALYHVYIVHRPQTCNFVELSVSSSVLAPFKSPHPGELSHDGGASGNSGHTVYQCSAVQGVQSYNTLAELHQGLNEGWVWAGWMWG